MAVASLLAVGAAGALALVQARAELLERAQGRLEAIGETIAVGLHERLLSAERALEGVLAADPAVPAFELDAALVQLEQGSRRLYGELSPVGDIEVPAGRTRLIVRGTSDAAEILLAKSVGGTVVLARVHPDFLWSAARQAPAGTSVCVSLPESAAPLHCTGSAPPDEAPSQGSALAAARTGGDPSALTARSVSSSPRALGGEPWMIDVRRPTTDVLEPLSALDSVLPQTVATMLALTLVITAVRLRRILRPLRRLASAATKSASRHPAGNRPATRSALRRRDEIDALGKAVNGMADTLTRQRAVLSTFAEIDRLLLSSRDTRQVLDAVADRISAVVEGCDIGVLLVDPDNADQGRLYCRSAAGRRDGELIRTSVSKELRVWLTCQPHGGLHALAEIRRRLREYPHELPDSKVFVIPILHGGELRATLFARFGALRTIPAPDLEALQGFASRCAVAISVAEREQQLMQRAYFDALTGLPNRRLCHDRLHQALAVARREEQKLAVVFIDLDGFKHVNDSLGHSSGDELLRETALRLSAGLRETDTVARLGGDEYVVILPHVQGVLEVEVILNSLLAAMRCPFHINGHTASVSASMGVTMFPHDGTTADELLRKADTALYGAKDAGRSRFMFFAQEMDQRVHERLALQTDLGSALANEELFLAFQPQIDLRTGQVVGAEALLRWRHSSRGLVPVSSFLPVLEETDLVESIGHWTFRTALAEIVRWKRNGSSIRRVAVNVATRQLFAPDFVEMLDDCLKAANVPGSCLEIELTEGSVVTDFEHSNDVLARLAKRGVHVAIDDFGTGYSSLGYLQDLTFDCVKIDRAFVHGLPDSKSFAIVKAVVEMAHSLGKHVVAEGIETELQRQQLAKLGCEIGQGFLLGRPLPATPFAKWLDNAEATRLIDEAFGFA